MGDQFLKTAKIIPDDLSKKKNTCLKLQQVLSYSELSIKCLKVYFVLFVYNSTTSNFQTSNSRLKYVCITDSKTAMNDSSKKIASLTFSLLDVKFPKIKQTRTTNSCNINRQKIQM